MSYAASMCSFCHARAEFEVDADPTPRTACALHLGDVLRDDRNDNAGVTEWKVTVVA